MLEDEEEEWEGVEGKKVRELEVLEELEVVEEMEVVAGQ